VSGLLHLIAAIDRAVNEAPRFMAAGAVVVGTIAAAKHALDQPKGGGRR